MNRLLLVGLGDIAWAAVHRLVDTGAMPAAAKLLETGSAAMLQTAGADLVSLWAGMMTGVPPRIHGIRGPFAVRPDGGGIQPVGARDWRSAPLWRILADAGVPSVAIACPGTAPASAWSDCVVLDERYASAPIYPEGDWPMPPGCAEPRELREAVRPMRVAPADLDDAICAGLPPRPMAYALSVHAAAMALAAQADWRFMAVTYPSLGDGDDACRFFDMLLDHLAGAAGKVADVIVVSSGGVLLAAGPGFAADHIVHGAAPLDIAVTVAARFGLAIEGATGRVLDGAVHGPCRTVSAAMPGVEPPTQGTPARAEPTGVIDMLERYQARLAGIEAAEGGDHATAARRFADALAEGGADIELELRLAQSAFLLGDAAACRAAGERIAAADAASPWGAMLVGAALALDGDGAADAHLAEAARRADGDVDALLRLGAIAIRRARFAEAERHYHAASNAAADRPAFQAAALAGLGLARQAQGDDAAAERMFKASLGRHYHAPEIHRQLGTLYVDQSRWVEAHDALRTALAQRPGLPGVAPALERTMRGIADAARSHVAV